MRPADEQTDTPDCVLVVGQPAVGKTTVARLLVTATDSRYCSLTELAKAGHRDQWLPPDVPSTPEPNGRFTDPTATRILTAAINNHHLPTDGTLTVLDDVITTGPSLHLLAMATPHPDRRLHVIEFSTNELLLAPRASPRSAAETNAFIDRLQKYQRDQPRLKTTAARHHIRWTHIDASPPAERCAAQAATAIGRPPRPPRKTPTQRQPIP